MSPPGRLVVVVDGLDARGLILHGSMSVWVWRGGE